MKKIIVLLIAVAMLLSVCAVTVGALTVTPYTDFSQVIKGELNPDKHDLINAGMAGGESDNIKFEIFASGEDNVPTIDGVCSDDEGYMPFENIDDYLYIGSTTDYGTRESFEEWYNWVADWDLVVKSCWDGTYLYMYFEYSIKDYDCRPASAAELWTWSCIQFGIGNRDAAGTNRSETGYGVYSGEGEDYGKSLATSWAGSYNPKDYGDNKDYKGTMVTDEKTGVTHLTHEFRINLQEALVREEPVASGENIKLCWVIIKNNNPQTFVSFCHGIAGNQSWKQSEHFCNVKLSGDVKYTPPVGNTNYYTPTADDLEFGYDAPSSIFFADIEEINDFSAENVTASLVTEDDVKFQRITNNGEEEANYTSARRFPTALAPMSNHVEYALIRYRTNDVTSLKLNFLGTSHINEEDGSTVTEFDPEYAVYPYDETPIIADGEWHYAFYYLPEYEYWSGVINKLAFVVPKGTIDIECIRFYTDDPAEIYENEGVEPIVTSTEAPTTTEEITTTVKEVETTAATTEKAPENNSGCKSAIASAAMIVTSIAAAWVLKKKH